MSALTLARSFWTLDRAADARREFQRAVDEHEVPEPYLRLCLAAVDRSPATRPTMGAVGP